MFLQPVSFIDYPNFGKEELTSSCSKDLVILNRFKNLYPKLSSSIYSSSLKNIKLKDISHIFKDYKDGFPYVDCGHYSPRASKLIAEHIFYEIFIDD